MALKIKLHESAGQFILDCVDTSTGESCVFPDYDITVFDHLVDAKIHLMRICRDFVVTGLHATIYENTPSGKKAVAEYDLSEELPQKMLGESHKPQEGLGFKVPKIRTIDKFEGAIAFAMAVRTCGRIKYPQAREYVNKQRDVNAPYHDNIHELDPEMYNSNIASVIGDVLLDYYGLL